MHLSIPILQDRPIYLAITHSFRITSHGPAILLIIFFIWNISFRKSYPIEYWYLKSYKNPFTVQFDYVILIK